ncbi:septum site-determining protein MinC [Chromobacterium subtsugae]|uniref:Probable septum site-determining protein MinC n=1 Tax=Chromobacterium subtsugae TaxID=251747 RepID=A0ABS7FAA4_9NEIS|nr:MULTISPECIES: septum site-determining protein MinC [Chromobacterium]KUM04542.1 septum site-determining protein MinC [Chromobacterium subtsugae]KZE87111.1 septum site-determining protein MinC [Chromobacterium sp. F49]MBW7565945.1 septum site-determining protein MinC [Chromobacterium subtsugae]MBW8287015.1 septum site-determining protein MinC [Chromobacterium subtsugae]WSE93093.1 septum site-determining protein MinC [Chromobacterium subtsugae]
MSPVANAFDIKSASLDLLAILLRTDNLDELSQALDARFGNTSGAPAEAFVLDVEALPNPAELDLGRLLPLLSRRGIRAVALRHPDNALAAVASQFGLAFASSAALPRSAQAPQEPAAKPAVEPAAAPAGAMIVDRPVRAGQQIYAKGCDLIVLAMVSAGAEVIADGNIHVYAPLRGRALAGARGNAAARIFTRSMEAELVSIAGVYRTIEQALPDSILGKPSQIYLENERLVMAALGE